MMSILKSIHLWLFAKNYEKVWKQFAAENNAVYKPTQEYIVASNYKGYTITIDSYTHYIESGGNTYKKEYVRAMVEFYDADHLELILTEEIFVDKIKKMLGYKEMQLGHLAFDEHFFIQGNDENKIRQLLSKEHLQEALLIQKPIRFCITKETGLFNESPTDNHSMIYFIAERKIKRMEQLQSIYQFMTNWVDELSNVGTMGKIKQPTL
jgi:hypothetical protein